MMKKWNLPNWVSLLIVMLATALFFSCAKNEVADLNDSIQNPIVDTEPDGEGSEPEIPETPDDPSLIPQEGELTEDGKPVVMLFGVKIDDGNEESEADADAESTKIHLEPKDASTYYNYWTEGDVVRINNTVSAALPAGNISKGGKRARFPMAEVVAKYNGNWYVGYPASAFSFSGGTGTVTVPTTQTYVSDSYDPAAYIIVGKSSSQETGFYPQMGIIRLTPRDASPASGLNIKSVKVEAIGGEPMSGRFTTDYDNASATFSPVVGQVNSYVQINAPNSTGLAFGTQFFFLVPARTYESGIRFVVTTTDNKSMTFSNPNSYEVGATATLSVKSPQYVPSEIAAPTLTAISSSSIGVAWSGANASNNTAKKWKIHVYSDSACNTEVRTITIPADAACWTDVGWDTTVAPALVVGRLSQGTTYYVKVEDVANAIVSPKASVTTDAFTLKAMPASIAAGATGLIYAEDFSEVGWGSAWFSNYNAGGFYPSSTTDFSNLSLDGADWLNPDREWSFRRTGLLPAIRASRLDDWYSEQTVNFHPGYLKLGQKGSNRKGFIITPEFPIADDKLAKVNVTLKVRKYDASAIGQYSVSVIRQLNVKNATTHESDFTWVVENAGDDDKLYQNVTVTALDSWGTYTVEGLYLQKGERIAFGTRKGADDDSGGTGKYRGMVAGVSVNAVSVDYPEIRVTLDEATSSTLSFRWTESNVDANKPDETALAYTASLYTKASCVGSSSRVQTYTFPSGSDGQTLWRGTGSNKQWPKFVFSGLNPDTQYYLKVTDQNNLRSLIIPVKTVAFDVVQMPASISSASAGVVLAEDFSELCWDSEFGYGGVGLAPSGSPTSYSDRSGGFVPYKDNAHFGGEVAGDYSMFTMGGNAPFRASRLNGSNTKATRWLYDKGTDDRIYAHPGYVTIGNEVASASDGSTKRRTWLLTPAFPVASGHTATVTVTFHARRGVTGAMLNYALVSLPSDRIGGDSSDYYSDFSWPSTRDATNLYEFTMAGNDSWQEFSVSGLKVKAGSRLAFGSVYASGGSSGTNGKISCLSLSDVTVTVTGYE